MSKAFPFFLFSSPLILSCLVVGNARVGAAQTAKADQGYPNHLPYTFGNIVWWNDEELRT